MHFFKMLKWNKQNIVKDFLGVSVGLIKTRISILKLFIWDITKNMFFLKKLLWNKSKLNNSLAHKLFCGYFSKTCLGRPKFKFIRKFQLEMKPNSFDTLQLLYETMKIVV